jgi:hypothetical protein
MSTIAQGLDPSVASRILEEGWGPGAWHGPDLKAALADVTPATAFWRPGRGRHNIAEIALHHAWCVRAVVKKLSASDPEPFLLDGEDWFEVSGKEGPSWPDVLAAVDAQQRRLAAAVVGAVPGRGQIPLTESERFELVLGVTCHAVYHAGQVQLIKRLQTQSGETEP